MLSPQFWQGFLIGSGSSFFLALWLSRIKAALVANKQ